MYKWKTMMEYKWLARHHHVLTLSFLLFCMSSLFPTLNAASADPPVIEVIGGRTNSSIVKFQNATHIVVASNVTTIVLTCNASYPVMWSLDSLEQPWVTATRTERVVPTFKDKSTYTYSMRVSLGNHNGYPYGTQSSLEPEEYTCYAADASNTLVSKLTVLWEWKHSYWNVKHNKLVNGTYQVYWKENQKGESSEILIPCYTINNDDAPVELYKREQNNTVRFLATDNGTVGQETSFARFEKYVGFFLNSSFEKADNENYECHLLLPSTRSKRDAYLDPLDWDSGSGESSGNVSTIIDDSDDDGATNGTRGDSEEAYVYVGSDEDVLGMRNTTSRKNMTEEEEPVEDDISNTIVPGSMSVVKFAVIKLNAATYQDETHTTRKQADTSFGTLSTYLNAENPNLILTHTDTTVTCCIKPGYNSAYTYDNVVLHHKWCSEPLMCLTAKHLLKKTYILYYAKYDNPVIGTRCRSIDLTGEYRSSFASNPSLYMCHMRTDRLVTRLGYNGDYDFKLHVNNSENSYFLSINNNSSFTTLQYYNQSSYTYITDISNVTFFDGESAQFRCVGNGFLYASTGYVWELEWKNGTSTQHEVQPVQPLYSSYNSVRVNLTDNLDKVSCHLPLWNSSDWVTRSFSIKVQASRPPTSISGSIVEDVEFYAGQSRVLNCDLQGHPPASYKWNLYSSVYSFAERTPIYYSTYRYYHRGSLTSTPSSYREPTTRNVTVSLYAANYVENSTLPIPQELFTCTATNVVGNGTKTFRVRAIRTVRPEIAFGSRDITVFFVHDEHKTLNCTIQRGSPFPEIYWQMHDMNISSSISEHEHYHIETVGNSSILTFKSIDYHDEGDYKCFAVNMAGRGFRQFSVRVRERPHSRYWYEFAIFVLTLVLILLFGSLAYVYVSKSKKINSLILRAEYSNLFGKHESRITVATLDE